MKNLKIKTIKIRKLDNDNKFHHPEYKSILRYDNKKIRADNSYKRALNNENF